MWLARTVAAETAAAGIAADTFAAGIVAAEMAGIGKPLAGEMIETQSPAAAAVAADAAGIAGSVAAGSSNWKVRSKPCSKPGRFAAVGSLAGSCFERPSDPDRSADDLVGATADAAAVASALAVPASEQGT